MADAGIFKRDDSRDEEILNLLIRDFIKRFEPECRRDRLDFEMRLHEIVRAVYQQAAKPYEQIMSSAVRAVSLQPFITPKP